MRHACYRGRLSATEVGHSVYIAGWWLSGGRSCGSHICMTIVVAIDTEDLYRLLVVFSNVETLE